MGLFSWLNESWTMNRYKIDFKLWTESGTKEKYDSQAKRFRIEQEDALELIEGGAEAGLTAKVWTSTEVKYGEECQHVMVLDCDAETDMLAACRYLFIHKIGYCAIESSEGRYWVVTNKVGTIDDVISLMKKVPGADSAHVEISGKRKFISIRAHPREGKSPIFPSDNYKLTNRVSINWMKTLRNYFDEVDKANESGLLRKAHKDGTMLKMVSHPSFEV
jgi:hypothetical protein